MTAERNTGFSRVFCQDTEHSSTASAILKRAERSMQIARLKVLALADLEFAYAGTGTGHVRRRDGAKALCGLVVRDIYDRAWHPLTCCRKCERQTLRIIGVWIFGEVSP